MFIINCRYCNKKIDNRNIGSREVDTEGKYVRIYFCSLECKNKYLLKRKKAKYTNCRYCGKRIKKTSNHEDICQQNPKNKKIVKCEYCGKEHNGSYGSGRFCSERCSRAFATENIKDKTKIVKCSICGKEIEVSKKALNSLICVECKAKKYNLKLNKSNKFIKKCVICGKEFDTLNPKRQTCSKKCARKLGEINLKNSDHYDDYVKRQSENGKRLIKEGKIKPWLSRKKCSKSYPEKFFIKVLNNNEIEFEDEYKADRYFIDFALLDKKIALEIDGKQHDEPHRKLSDKQKDKKLAELGWKVYRIRWNYINNAKGKEIMKEKIDKFLDFYKAV